MQVSAEGVAACGFCWVSDTSGPFFHGRGDRAHASLEGFQALNSEMVGDWTAVGSEMVA